MERYFILGCGHSGTSLISGLLHINGYRTENINHLYENNQLLKITSKLLNENNNEKIEEEISSFFNALEQKNSNYVLKDPRLSECFNYIYKFIPGPIKLIYIFRDPRPTVNHLIKERHQPELTNAEKKIDAEKEWYKRNNLIIEFLEGHQSIPFIMLDYDDLVNRKIDIVLEVFLGKELNLSFIEPKKRKSNKINVSDNLMELYTKLINKYYYNIGKTISVKKANIKKDKISDKFLSKRYILSSKIKRRLRRERS